MTPFILALVLAFQTPADNFSILRDQWARNLHEKQIEASVNAYAEDADFIVPGGNRTHGKVAIRQLFQTITTTFDSDLVFASQRVDISGDLAYDSGTFRETLVTRATGKHQESTGSYVTIYRRSKDGAWLIVQQVWTGPPIEPDAK